MTSTRLDTLLWTVELKTWHCRQLHRDSAAVQSSLVKREKFYLHFQLSRRSNVVRGDLNALDDWISVTFLSASYLYRSEIRPCHRWIHQINFMTTLRLLRTTFYSLFLFLLLITDQRKKFANFTRSTWKVNSNSWHHADTIKRHRLLASRN